MAITNADILGWLNANPNANDDLIYKTMVEAGVTTDQYLSATGKPLPRGASTSQVTNADILGWLNANPGASPALISETMKAAGVTSAQYQSATGSRLPTVTAPTPIPLPVSVADTQPPVPQVSTPQAAPTPPSQGMLSGAVQAPTTPAVTNADILGWFNANPNADAALVNQTMQAAGVSPSQVSSALASNPDVAKTYLTQQILGQGTTEKWTGEGKGSPQANAADMANILAGIGITDISQFGQIQKKVVDENGNESVVTTYGNKLTGQEVPNTYSERQSGNAFGGTFQGSGNTGYRVEFDAQGKPLFYTTGASSSDVPSWVKPALIIGAAMYGLDASGLLGGLGAGAGAGAAGLTAAEAAALTAGDLAIGAGTYGAGAYGAGAAGLGAAGLTASEIAALTAGDLAIGGTAGAAGLLPTAATAGLTAAEIAALNATDLAIGTGAPTATGLLSAAPIIAAPTGLPPTGLPSTGIPPSLINAGVSTAVNSLLGGGGTSNIPNLISGGLGTAGNLLQMQQSREAAQAAQARIDAETAAAKASAAFRPIGMTTRFGTSQFQVDPATGQLTSAGYTLSPEAKAQQDRFMALSNQGLTQAEQAQGQFAPLQTGAQRLFGLGNQYLAQSPESVAQNYLNQQMALLQPGRELELANLQNKLQQQGRGGLAVAQGGAYGATTPELQALYNARAQQEAQLAANAQQAGQQQVAFGAGLLGTGAQTMGQYYAGQQAAYAPYTTAMGQVQGLEALGQQPLTTGINLGQISSTAGANVAKLGLTGAQLSTNLATSADATRNLGAQSLIAAGNPNAMFGQSLGNIFGGLFSGTPQGSLTAGIPLSSVQATENLYPSLYY